MTLEHWIQLAFFYVTGWAGICVIIRDELKSCPENIISPLRTVAFCLMGGLFWLAFAFTDDPSITVPPGIRTVVDPTPEPGPEGYIHPRTVGEAHANANTWSALVSDDMASMGADVRAREPAEAMNARNNQLIEALARQATEFPRPRRIRVAEIPEDNEVERDDAAPVPLSRNIYNPDAPQWYEDELYRLRHEIDVERGMVFVHYYRARDYITFEWLEENGFSLTYAVPMLRHDGLRVRVDVIHRTEHSDYYANATEEEPVAEADVEEDYRNLYDEFNRWQESTYHSSVPPGPSVWANKLRIENASTYQVWLPDNI